MSLTTEQINKLAAPLDASRVKTRQGGNGGNLSYLETHDVIRAANEIFGFGQWGHRITRLQPLDQVTVHNREQKVGIHVGYLCAVELTVDGCQPVSGIGYGDATEYRESAPVTAHELAAKEAESDALKRALKNYGDQFGLILYSKDAPRSEHLNGASPNGGGGGQPHRPAAEPHTGDPAGYVWQSGKHAGQSLAETERGYIEWYAANGPKADVKKVCRDYLAATGESHGGNDFSAPANEAETLAAFAADDGIPF